MYVIGTPKAAKAFEARLQTAIRNAKLFATDAQETNFLAAANDAYTRVARKNAIKVIVLPEQFFDMHNLLRNISTSPNQNARQKLLDNPELLFTTRNIDVPKNESPVTTQPLAKSPKDQKFKSKLTIDMVREAVLYHLEHHDGRKPSQLTGVIEAGNPLHDGKRTWKSVNMDFSRQGMGLKGTEFKSLSDFCKRDPAIKEKTKTKTKTKIKLEEKTKTILTLDTVRKAVLHHLEHHDGKNPTQHTGVIEAENPLHDGTRTWMSINAAFAQEGLGLKDTGFKSLSDFCKRDPSIKEKTKTKLTLDTVREAILHHLQKHDGKKPNTHTGVIEAGNPLHDGTRTWVSINAAFVHQGMGLKGTGFKSLPDFCKRDPAIKEKTKTKTKLTLDTVREAILHHLQKHDGKNPNTYTGMIEAGNPLHDGTRTWMSINAAFVQEGLGLKNTGFKSLSDFCKRDPAIKEKTKVKNKLALDTVRKAVLYHIEKHDGKNPNTHTGIIEAGNPLHDGKRTWFSFNTAFVSKRLDMKYTVFKSLFDFCRRDQDIQKFILDRKSAKNKFNYAALIETMVAHTNETKSQPDELDKTPIQHGPLANGLLTWSNVACALHKNDKRLRQAADAARTDLNTLFEQAVLTRPDVIKYFSLPLPAEMREDQTPQRSKGRRTTSSAPAGDFTVIVTLR